MSNNLFGLLVLGIFTVGIIAYGIVMMKTAKAINDAQKTYYTYLKNYKHRNISDYYTARDSQPGGSDG